MNSQGWKEGEYLGAKDAAHAVFHTAANYSHIRVAVKDDTLGLGAKTGSGVGHGECTGLDAFKNLLGRLNGKKEKEIIKEQEARDNARNKILIDRRWGCMNFVSAGFLVGDKIQSMNETETPKAERHIKKADKMLVCVDGNNNSPGHNISICTSEVKHTRPRKRKADVFNEKDADRAPESSKKTKRKHRLRNDTNSTEEPIEQKNKITKKSKKTRTKITSPEQDESDSSRNNDNKCKKSRKKNKSVSNSKNTGKSSRQSKHSKRKGGSKFAQSLNDALQSNLSSATECIAPEISKNIESERPVVMQGRHIVRSKNIAQKRLASMDTASLNQVSLLKLLLQFEYTDTKDFHD